MSARVPRSAEPQEAAAERAKQAALESQAQQLRAQAQEDSLAERRDRLRDIDNVRFLRAAALSGCHALLGFTDRILRRCTLTDVAT